MDVIVSALEEEYQQAKRLLGRYQEELAQLPKGTFFVRKVGKGTYGYLTLSESGRIKQQYLGKMSQEEIKKYKEWMTRKKQLKGLGKKAQMQMSFLEKSLRHARKKS